MGKPTSERQAIVSLLREHSDIDAERFAPREIRYADNLKGQDDQTKIFFRGLSGGVAKYALEHTREEEYYDEDLENYRGFTTPYPYRGVLVRQGLVGFAEREIAEEQGIDPDQAWRAELLVASAILPDDTLVSTEHSVVYEYSAFRAAAIA